MYLFTRVKKGKTKNNKRMIIVSKFFLHYFIKWRNFSSADNILEKL